VERHPTATFVPHQRYVVDGNVATTTGISASIPTMLALVEGIGGRDKAQAVAADIGVAAWTPAHDSTPFRLDGRRRAAFLLNKAAFWRQQDWQVDVRDGMDDITLALVADAWTRLDRGDVEVVAPQSRVTLG